MSRSMSFIRAASDRLSNTALISDRRRSPSSMTSPWCPGSTVSVLIASAIDAVPPGDCGDLDGEPASGQALARCYSVGVSIDLGAGPQDQLSIVVASKFVEGEIDVCGGAVGGSAPPPPPPSPPPPTPRSGV